MSIAQDIVFYIECYSNNCEEMTLQETRCIMCYIAYDMIMKGDY